MQFENLSVADGKPEFRVFLFRDRNPLGLTEKVRTLRAPNKAMRQIHMKLVYWLRSNRSTLDYSAVTACRRGCSVRKNVIRHIGNRFFYLTDLHDAYPSVNGQKLAGILCSAFPVLASQEMEVLKFLQLYCLVTPEGGLIIGAPASPDLFNIYAAALIDKPMMGFCHKEGITVTRYLDDLTLSSNERLGRRTRKRIREIISGSGLMVNHAKSQIVDITTKGFVVINGMGLSSEGLTFVPEHYMAQIETELDDFIDKGVGSINRIRGMKSVFRQATDLFTMREIDRRVLAKFKTAESLESARARLKQGASR